MLKKYFALWSVVVAASFKVHAQAPEPAAQPSNILFGNVKTYGFTMKFTRTSADGYLVLKSTQNITDVPVDGVLYEKGQGLATSKVLSVSNADSFSVREVVENTAYYFRVFAYNGSGVNINYRQANPLSGGVQTPESDAGNYYSSVDSSAPGFINSLHNLINNHIFISYSPGYRTTILPVIYERDTIAGNAVINCEYSDEVTVYTPPFDFSATDYSREHALCRSWMQTYPTYGSNIISRPEGADFFNLLLTQQSQVNAVRSNYPLGEVVSLTSSYKGTKFGFDSRGKKVFEPREDKKGDVARCMMYQMVAYDGLSGSWALQNLLGDGPDQQQSVLKQWHQQDPPDKFERTKNDFIFSIQSNRNPFIDNPQWVDCINFDNLYKTSLCGFMTGIEEQNNVESLRVYPNPNQGMFTIELMSSQSALAYIEITNILGSKHMAKTQMISTGMNQLSVRQTDLPKGTYFVRVSLAGQDTFAKMVIAD